MSKPTVPVTFYPDRIFFTFPDGVFSYECRNCGACCKGLGIGLDGAAGETERLVEAYPELGNFVRRKGSAWSAFNPRGRCWFLDDDGWCRVERDHGRTAKPAACRLFPFNRIFWMGTWAIVDYNSVICPLKALPEEADDDAVGLSGRVRHAELLDDLKTIMDPAVIGTQLPIENANAAGRAFHTRENAIAQACFEASKQTEEPDWKDLLAKISADPALIATVSDALAAILGVPWSPPKASARHGLLLTPSMRFNALFGPRPYAPYEAQVKLLPAMWLVWLHMLGQGEKLAKRMLTLQEATSMWGEVALLGYIASRWNAVPTVEPGPIELTAQGDTHQRIMALGNACVHNTKDAPLSALLQPSLDGLNRVERIALVREAEPLWRKMRWGKTEVSAGKPQRRKKRRRK